MHREDGGGGCNITVREEHAWMLDSIWTENYTLSLHFSQANRKFHSFSQVAHGRLLRHLLPADPDSTVGRAVAGQSLGLLKSQLNVGSMMQCGLSHHGARGQGQGWAVVLS